MLLLAEIPSIWNRANHFYCHDAFHLTFLLRRVRPPRQFINTRLLANEIPEILRD